MRANRNFRDFKQKQGVIMKKLIILALMGLSLSIGTVSSIGTVLSIGTVSASSTEEERIYSQLVSAIYNGEAQKVKRILKENSTMDFNSGDFKNKLGENLLHIAIGDFRIKNIAFSAANMAEIILKYSAIDINDVDANGKTPLYKTVENFDYVTVTFLLEEGADPNIPSTDGNKPLDYILYQFCKNLETILDEVINGSLNEHSIATQEECVGLIYGNRLKTIENLMQYGTKIDDDKLTEFNSQLKEAEATFGKKKFRERMISIIIDEYKNYSSPAEVTIQKQKTTDEINALTTLITQIYNLINHA
jgi:hypothetical protein